MSSCFSLISTSSRYDILLSNILLLSVHVCVCECVHGVGGEVPGEATREVTSGVTTAVFCIPELWSNSPSLFKKLQFS